MEYSVIPAKASAGFVAKMEDILEVYTRPHDDSRPLVCLDADLKTADRRNQNAHPHEAGTACRYD